MLRETINQLAIQNGRPNYPTEEDIAQAEMIVANDTIHRQRTGLEPREPFPFPDDYGYDEECYPNFFSCSIKHTLTGRRWIFEISEWIDQSKDLYQMLITLMQNKCRMVGFNNEHYDYSLLHFFMESQGLATYADLYQRSCAIFADHTGYAFNVWPNKRFIKQVDLLKIHHFDNRAKSTSLKMLEFNMRSRNIKDLPYPVGVPIKYEQRGNLLTYNDHDTDETIQFYIHSLPMIQFREELSQKYNRDFTNHNDTKIGKDYFIMKLNEAGIQTGKHIQSKRNSVALADVIFPYITFERPEFIEILNFFKSSVIDKKDKKGNLELKGFFKGVTATLDGFDFDFGAGGIHGSLHKTVVRETDTHALIDIDVASYYPNIAIVNGLYPEHLSDRFCEIYLALYKMRVECKKEMKSLDKNSDRYEQLDNMQAMLKLALNGVYGSSNDIHSPFLDPKFTLATTINGQLMLCMLAEHLMKIPTLKMVQINTDGLTFLCPREHVDHAMNLKTWWEQLTKLELERADYSMMAIRDVNSYLALTKENKVKRIGAYAYELALNNSSTRELTWCKDQSAVVVAKAAEAALVHNKPIPEFILNHDDEFDFMLRTKVPRDSRLELHDNIMWGDTVALKRIIKLQNISRYYISKTGGKLVKFMPPTQTMIDNWKTGIHYQHEETGDYKVVKPDKKPPSGRYKLVPSDQIKPDPFDRDISINSGWLVTDCSNMDDYYDDKAPEINYDYYIAEARKLVDELLL